MQKSVIKPTRTIFQQRIKKPAGVAGLALLIWLIYCAYMIVAFGNKTTAARADAAIVLGAGVSNNLPSPVFKARIDHAVNLYQQNRVAHLIFTGSVGEGDTLSESAVAAQYAINAGVPAAQIQTESVSHTTQQNVAQAANIMQHNHWQTALIVSDPLHLKRASIMAQDLGLSAISSPTPTTQYQSWRVKTGFLLREVYFVQHYWLTGH
jgi:uncharacterized SAM-binding protein YcdF (DUF218 family)